MQSCTFPAMRWLLVCAAAAALTACGIVDPQGTRSARLGAQEAPLPQPRLQTRSLALGLSATVDGQGLTQDGIAMANEMLTRQGRIDAQAISIVPFNEHGAAIAQRLAVALIRNGARTPKVEAIPSDPKRLEQAAVAGWALELRSEALVVQEVRCTVAKPDEWAVHPFYGVGTLGCANRANLARMASDPRDLVRPRALEGGDARAAALAVQRYQSGEVRELIDIDFSSDN